MMLRTHPILGSRHPRAAGRAVLPAAFALLITGHAGAQAPTPATDQSPRPAEEVVPAGEGVEAAQPASVYPGDYLFDYIDGGAPQYIEYGFHEVASLELTLSDRTYVFDVYRMDSPLAAWGIFSTRRPPAAPPLAGFPYSSFTSFQGMAAHGPYFIDISAFEPGEDTAAAMSRLLSLAATRVDAALVRTDIGAGDPFTRLPGSGHLPGSEKLARGPISLRAALGAASGGALGAALDAVLTAQAALALRAGGGGRLGPWWVVAGYHPATNDDDRLVPQTTLALLAAEEDATPLLQAAGDALDARGGAQALEGGRGWSWSEADGRGGFVLLRGGDLLCVTSVLEADLLRAWMQSLAAR